MILPNKHVRTKYSLIGLGALILQNLNRPQQVSTLWEKLREFPEVGTFERFILALDFLYTIGAIEFENNQLRRITDDSRS